VFDIYMAGVFEKPLIFTLGCNSPSPQRSVSKWSLEWKWQSLIVITGLFSKGSFEKRPKHCPPRISISSPTTMSNLGWLRLVGSFILDVSFVEYRLFYRSLFAKETYHFKEPTHRSHLIFLFWDILVVDWHMAGVFEVLLIFTLSRVAR